MHCKAKTITIENLTDSKLTDYTNVFFNLTVTFFQLSYYGSFKATERALGQQYLIWQVNNWNS